jgi:hypothetical protein
MSSTSPRRLKRDPSPQSRRRAVCRLFAQSHRRFGTAGRSMTDKLADILERLERVEAAVAGIGHNGGPALDDPPGPSDPDLEAQDRRLTAHISAQRTRVGS